MPLDAALIQVTPPDAQGLCSLGVSVDIVKAAVKSARLVIAQVHSLLPRTQGDSFIHIDEIDFLIEYSEAIREVPPISTDDLTPCNEIVQRIAANVARLVKDGATLQVGSGALPNVVLAHRGDRNDLGIQAELLSDGLMQPTDATNSCKTA